MEGRCYQGHAYKEMHSAECSKYRGKCSRCSTCDVMFVMRRQQKLVVQYTPLYTCFIDLGRAYDSADRTLLWIVLAWSRMPAKIITVILRFLHGMRGCLSMDDGERDRSSDNGRC